MAAPRSAREIYTLVLLVVGHLAWKRTFKNKLRPQLRRTNYNENILKQKSELFFKTDSIFGDRKGERISC